MVHFNVGYNYRADVLDLLTELQGKGIDEVYAHIPSMLKSVRPMNRQVQVLESQFIEHSEKLNQIGIKMNAAINNYCIGDVDHYRGTYENKAVNEIRKLDTYIDRYIVASPVILDLLSSVSKKPVTISTIWNIRTIPEIMAIKDRYPQVDRICMSIYMNRSVNKLMQMQTYLRQFKINLELIVNEFCFTNSPCIYRQHCYMSQSHAFTQSCWPMIECVAARNKYPSSWVKAPYILPSWIDYYIKSTGIEYYKITGRTGDIAYLHKIYDAYTTRQDLPSLADHWFNVDGIANVDNPPPDIDTSIIADKLLRHIDESETCYDQCTIRCGFCERLFEIATDDKG